MHPFVITGLLLLFQCLPTATAASQCSQLRQPCAPKADELVDLVKGDANRTCTTLRLKTTVHFEGYALITSKHVDSVDSCNAAISQLVRDCIVDNGGQNKFYGGTIDHGGVTYNLSNTHFPRSPLVSNAGSCGPSPASSSTPPKAKHTPASIRSSHLSPKPSTPEPKAASKSPPHATSSHVPAKSTPSPIPSSVVLQSIKNATAAVDYLKHNTNSTAAQENALHKIQAAAAVAAAAGASGLVTALSTATIVAQHVIDGTASVGDLAAAVEAAGAAEGGNDGNINHSHDNVHSSDNPSRAKSSTLVTSTHRPSSRSSTVSSRTSASVDTCPSDVAYALKNEKREISSESNILQARKPDDDITGINSCSFGPGQNVKQAPYLAARALVNAVDQATVNAGNPNNKFIIDSFADIPKWFVSEPSCTAPYYRWQLIGDGQMARQNRYGSQSIDHVWEKKLLVRFLQTRIDDSVTRGALTCAEMEDVFFHCGNSNMQKIFSQVETFTSGSPAIYKPGFAGMSKSINKAKGDILETGPNVGLNYPTLLQTFSGPTANFPASIVALQNFALAFDVCRQGSIAQMFDVTNNRIYQAFIALDEFIRAEGLIGGGITDDWADSFQKWMTAYLTTAGTQAVAWATKTVNTIDTAIQADPALAHDPVEKIRRRGRLTLLQDSPLWGSSKFNFDSIKAGLTWNKGTPASRATLGLAKRFFNGKEQAAGGGGACSKSPPPASPSPSPSKSPAPHPSPSPLPSPSPSTPPPALPPTTPPTASTSLPPLPPNLVGGPLFITTLLPNTPTFNITYTRSQYPQFFVAYTSWSFVASPDVLTAFNVDASLSGQGEQSSLTCRTFGFQNLDGEETVTISGTVRDVLLGGAGTEGYTLRVLGYGELSDAAFGCDVQLPSQVPVAVTTVTVVQAATGVARV